MTDAADQASTRGGRTRFRPSQVLANMARTAGPPLLLGLRLWVSACLALYVAFWLELDNAFWAGSTAAIVCQPQLGASLRKGWYRMIGTVVGAVAIMVLTGLFPQAREPFLIGLATWCAMCALSTTLLRNFASYAAALAGYTAVIIAGDGLGATGGPNANDFFRLAVTRASEICIGIVSAGIVLAGTDLGGARRRLTASFAALSAEITGRFVGMLALAGPRMPETYAARRELVRRVIALDPAIDVAKGESSQIRYHSPVLQSAMDGLFAALVGWRAAAVLLAKIPESEVQQEAGAVLRVIPQKLRSAEFGVPAQWIADPAGMRETCEKVKRELYDLPADTPSLRLLADQTAKIMAGVAAAFNGLALLAGAPVCFPPRGTRMPVRVPDWLPSLVNAGRAFITIGAVALFWIVTEWPNGTGAITFAAITVLLFAPRADQAAGIAASYMIGTILGVAITAVITFAVLPGLETFEAFCLVIGLYLIPVGALTGQTWQKMMFSAMIIVFLPMLGATNQMSYDTEQFYNAALAIIAGTAAALLSFCLLPPPSPAFRTRRLLALTLRELRHLARNSTSWTIGAWEGQIYGRLEAIPDEARPVERARLLAALTVGTEIIRLRHIEPDLGFGSCFDAAFTAIAAGNSQVAAGRLAEIDARLTACSDGSATTPMALRARASMLAISEALDEHASYFDAQVP